MILGCRKESQQSFKVPNVRSQYEIVVYPGADSTYPVGSSDKAKLTLLGELSDSFKIFFGPLQTSPIDLPITEVLEFQKLETSFEFKTDWYGDPMWIRYFPSQRVAAGSLTIQVTFYAIE
jgi:hypothetical protein